MRISTLVLATCAGFVAGAISSRLTPVYAQGSGVEILQSKQFVLLDGSGHKRGEWKVDSSGQPVLRLFDAHGHVIWDTTGAVRPRLAHEP
jgi:hypothetical protein